MEHFAIGWLSFVVPVMLTLAYLAGYQARRMAACSKRQEGPTDRVVFFMSVALALGFVLDCLAAAGVEQSREVMGC